MVAEGFRRNGRVPFGCYGYQPGLDVAEIAADAPRARDLDIGIGGEILERLTGRQRDETSARGLCRHWLRGRKVEIIPKRADWLPASRRAPAKAGSSASRGMGFRAARRPAKSKDAHVLAHQVKRLTSHVRQAGLCGDEPGSAETGDDRGDHG